ARLRGSGRCRPRLSTDAARAGPGRVSRLGAHAGTASGWGTPAKHLHALPPSRLAAILAAESPEELRAPPTCEAGADRTRHLVPVRIVDDHQRVVDQIRLDQPEPPHLGSVIVGRIVVVHPDPSVAESASAEQREGVSLQDGVAAEPVASEVRVKAPPA